MGQTSRPRGRVFISYRRGSTSYPVNWLYDLLVTKFGNDLIFKDVDNIKPGEDFVQELTAAVISCDVLLAVIGPDWMTVTDGQGNRRLDDPTDWVRLELEIALARGVRVIPLLVEGAQMPPEADLPRKLAPLVRRQAHELSPQHFKRDADLLLAVVEDVLMGRDELGSRSVGEQPTYGQAESGGAGSPGNGAREIDRTVINQPPVRANAKATSRAWGAASSGAGTVEPSSEDVGSPPARRWPRPRLFMVLGGAALALSIILVASALMNPRAGSVLPSNTQTARATAIELPQSDQPLGDDVLVWRVSRADGVWQIVTVDLQGNILRVLAEGGEDLISPVISRDRRTVLYRDEDSRGVRSLHAVSSDGKLRRDLFSDSPTCPRILRPALTHDGLLVMPCGGGSNTKFETLRVFSLDGEVIRTIDHGAHMGDVTLSPDESSVVYWRDKSRKYPSAGALVSAALDGSSRRPLTTGVAGQDGQAVISPRGDRLIFTRLENGRRSLQTLDLNASGVDNFEPLLDSTLNEEDPSWSPNGLRVVFRAGETADADKHGFTDASPLFMVSATGDVPVQISGDFDIGTGPAWTTR